MPRQIRETSRPVLPNFTYSMSRLPVFVRRAGQRPVTWSRQLCCGCKAKHPLSLGAGEPGLGPGERDAHLDVRELGGDRLGGRPGQYRVGVGDDEHLEATPVVLQCQPHGTGPVPPVDVGPDVPAPAGQVVLEGREPGVVLDRHHVGEAQAVHLQGRIPPAQLLGELLLQVLGERVRGLRPGRVLLVHRQVRRRGGERQPEQGLAGGPDDVADAGCPRGREDVVAGGDVVGEGGRVGGDPRPRDGGQVHQRVDPGVPLVDGVSASTVCP